MQELCHALTGPLEALYEKLPPIENELYYRVRYCITFFPDLVYKTRFLEHVYKKASYQDCEIHFRFFHLLEDNYAIAPLCGIRLTAALLKRSTLIICVPLTFSSYSKHFTTKFGQNTLFQTIYSLITFRCILRSFTPLKSFARIIQTVLS